jgi:DNA adenine methylase
VAALVANLFKTPLRYPGGKRKLANFVKLTLRLNQQLDVSYVEPFAGGAGVALALLLGEYARDIHINDLDPCVFAFWSSVLDATDELCSLIHDTPVTINEWHHQQELFRHRDDVTSLQLGFATFFLNRTNRSGILSGGVIGGKAQSGKWKLDARYNKEDLISRIRMISKYRNRIHVYNQDAAAFLQVTLPQIGPDSFTYLDPPYYVKGKDLYVNAYDHAAHAQIAELVAEIDTPWIVSYDAVAEIKHLYAPFRSIQYGINYSAGESYRGAEVIFFSDDLRIPEVSDPTKIPAKLLSR